jgi:hypothetical protein
VKRLLQVSTFAGHQPGFRYPALTPLPLLRLHLLRLARCRVFWLFLLVMLL